MPYADSDFFIALLKPGDRLYRPAVEIYEKYKGHIYTSLAAVMEVMIVGKRVNIDPEALLAGTTSIARVYDVDEIKLARAARLMKYDGFGIFDAFHAAFCDGEIISSDHVYDRAGIRRIKIQY
jgi:predicted nucleic acid-binding protein